MSVCCYKNYEPSCQRKVSVTIVHEDSNFSEQTFDLCAKCWSRVKNSGNYQTTYIVAAFWIEELYLRMVNKNGDSRIPSHKR